MGSDSQEDADDAPDRSSSQWEETEDAGDELLPLDGDLVDMTAAPAPDSPPSDSAAEPEPEPDRPARPTPPPPPVYPTPPCYVTVGQGDCVLSLAKRYRLLPKQIWDAPENADLKNQQKRAYNVLLPGDQVYVPAPRIKHVDGATEQRHRFKLPSLPCKLRLKLLRQGKPRSGLDYELQVKDKQFKGKTDGQGVLEEKIPADAQQGTLTLYPDTGAEVYPLKLGHLNPVEDTTGVQARLNHLGFACGQVDGDAGPMTASAIAAFQQAHHLEVTGKMDDATRDKLVEVHGS